MLGHADISSTGVYARFVKSKYTAAYAKFHPLHAETEFYIKNRLSAELSAGGFNRC